MGPIPEWASRREPSGSTTVAALMSVRRPRRFGQSRGSPVRRRDERAGAVRLSSARSAAQLPQSSGGPIAPPGRVSRPGAGRKHGRQRNDHRGLDMDRSRRWGGNCLSESGGPGVHGLRQSARRDPRPEPLLERQACPQRRSPGGRRNPGQPNRPEHRLWPSCRPRRRNRLRTLGSAATSYARSFQRLFRRATGRRGKTSRTAGRSARSKSHLARSAGVIVECPPHRKCRKHAGRDERCCDKRCGRDPACSLAWPCRSANRKPPTWYLLTP